jgi:regulatory protein YycH of two-component signal transduction system YycFG
MKASMIARLGKLLLFILLQERLSSISQKKFFVLMLKKCKSILNDNGLILFTTPNPNSILVKLGNKAVFNDPSHVNIMSINKFKKIVFESGLRVAEIKGSGKVTRYISPNFPFINLFGSYLSILTK